MFTIFYVANGNPNAVEVPAEKVDSMIKFLWDCGADVTSVWREDGSKIA